MKRLPVARCRPRVEGEREAQILAATVDLLVEHGYGRLSLDAVATSARVSKATLYRRWAGKAELVLDAVAHVRSCIEPPRCDTGDLRCDLVEIGRAPGGLTDPLLVGILGAVGPATQQGVGLSARVSSLVLAPVHQALLAALTAAAERGDLARGADLEVLADILPALAMHQVFVLGRPVSAERIAYLVDTAVLPACRATAGDALPA